MIWKTLFITFLAVGCLAEYKLTDEQEQKAREVLKEVCKKYGAENKTDEVVDAVKVFGNCVKELFDFDTIKKEIEEAKPKGTLDEVFKKYCEKAPQLKTCIANFKEKALLCVDPAIKSQMGNETDSLIDFVCYKDGDRIALFIAEGGPECISSKAGELQTCFNQVKDSVGSVENANSLTLEDRCKKFDEVSACAVKALEGCSAPTTANMVESLLRYVKNASPCPKKA